VNVIVDTSVWSLALRRSPEVESAILDELRTLITDRRVQLLGPIRQELLSGVRSLDQFERLRTLLAAYPDLPLAEDDYVLAATFFNTCRARGIQGSNTDFLICAASANHHLSIFTTDQDFTRFVDHVPIHLHTMR
jgi:predicted nucleic acid-binding protein